MILVIGAQKSGTTWLYNFFKSFENFKTEGVKEYHFFKNQDKKIKRLVSLIRHVVLGTITFGQFFKFTLMLLNEKFYFYHFTKLIEKDSFTADITPAYFNLSSEKLKKIKEVFKKNNINTKIIFIMRDPVDRAFSQYNMEIKRRAKYKKLSFKDFFLTPECYEKSKYETTLSNLQTSLKKDEIFITFYEKLFNKTTLKEIAAFVSPVKSDPNYGLTNNIIFSNNNQKNIIKKEDKKFVKNFLNKTYKLCNKEFPITKKIWE